MLNIVKKRTQWLLRILPLTFFTLTMLPVNETFIYQEDAADEAHIILLRYEHGEFRELEPFTAEQRLLFKFNSEMGQILDFEFNNSLDSGYIVEGAGCCGGITAGESQLVKVNLVTGETETMYPGRNFLEITPIPNSPNFLLSYYDPELQRIRDETPRFCIFELETGNCTDELGLASYSRVGWVNQNHFIGDVTLQAGAEVSYLVNATNRERLELPIFAPHWALFPSTNELLVSSPNSAGTFERLNLDTLVVSSYKVEGDYNSSALFYPVSFSPNGEYLLFVYEYTYIIAEFATGEIITEFPNSSNPQWFDDNNIIYIHYPERGSYPGEILRFNLVSGESVQLTEFNKSTIFNIVR